MCRNEGYFLSEVSITSRRYPGTSTFNDQNGTKGGRTPLVKLSCHITRKLQCQRGSRSTVMERHDPVPRDPPFQETYKRLNHGLYTPTKRVKVLSVHLYPHRGK